MIHHPPVMVDPLGLHWDQPSRSEVLIDDDCAVMSKEAFNLLGEYSSTLPSAVYEGKMWKCQRAGEWFLRWFGTSEDPKMCSINTRKILLLEDAKGRP